MPFMKGRGALRRTVEFLEKGEILFRPDVRIMTFGYNPGQKFVHHQGLYKFIFWHLPQLKYKNPQTQFLTFKKMTPTPWIRAYMDDDSEVVFDCDSRSREEIHEQILNVLGKSRETILKEEMALTAKVANPANFGFKFQRECICEIPGQVPCPAFKALPTEMTGKYMAKLYHERKEQQ